VAGGIAGEHPRIGFGAAYYPEYLGLSRIATDLDLMAQAGFTLIRVGESVWSTWEPSDGDFQLDWLVPVFDGAHERGIGVVLGTPTYAVPPWLMTEHPEIAAERATGTRVPWGVRQETEIGHPVFRHYAERIIRAVVGRYAEHPALVGVQVDNEPGQHLAHNAHVMAEFRGWLLSRFGGVEAINEAWNLAHWAHRLTDIDQLWVPDGNHVPQYDLAWRRFHAERTADYIRWQAEIVRQIVGAQIFVTTCIDRMPPAADDRALGRAVDIPAANLYVATQDALGADHPGDPAFPSSGSWAPFLLADRAWAISDGPFLVTETNATSVGHPWFNRPAYDGQWRQIAWALIARGARSIGYWHWHSMHASWETQWAGILPHSLEPGRVYGEIARIGTEIAAAGAAVEGLVPEATIGVVVSNPARWAWEYHPPLQDPRDDPNKQGGPDRLAADRLVHRIAGGFHRAGHQVRIRHLDSILAEDADTLVADLPVLVVAGISILGDDDIAALRDYVAAGGHLVIGPRAALADADGRYRVAPSPAGLSDLAGVRIEEFSNITGTMPVRGLPGEAEGIVDGVVVTDAEVVAEYEHPHFGRWPALTTRRAGAGRVTVLGTVPSLALAESLGRWIAATTLAAAPVTPFAAPVALGTVAHSARNAAGARVWFIHRLAGSPDRAALTRSFRDVLSGVETDQLDLAAWDVRIVEEIA
jgi:beta-galactosidase